MASGPLVVGLGGSAGPESTSGALLRDALRRVQACGARTVAFDGERLAALPIFNPHDALPGPVGDELLEAVRRADALVIATPGYHGGMSGLVKNALDHLELLRDDARPYLDGRAVGIIVATSGWQSCGTALVAVRSAVHALRGWPTPFGLTVNTAEQAIDDDRVRGGMAVLTAQLMAFTAWRAAAEREAARRTPARTEREVTR
ncbi:MAG: NADPH-dependent oxidoreductase [Jatrophihabitans sp.]|nr:MAG: NADPH-dependent oxidoreductase [Jatrophihabitans sp.]